MIDPSLAMDRLEKRMKQLQVDFQRFFSGAIDLPPQELADSIRNGLRQLRNSGGLSPSDNYRLGALEARFTSYSQLNQRRLRELEVDIQPRAARASSPSRRRAAPEPVIVGDGDSGRAAYARLYEQLYPDGSGEARGVTLDRFSDYLADHVDRVRGKTGCDEVRLRVREEGGKRKLKVQPLDRPDAGKAGD
jgi:hypothetical protein